MVTNNLLKNLLEKYKQDDYVYIYDGCSQLFASKHQHESAHCETCGDCDILLLQGKVSTLLKMTNKELDKQINSWYF